MARCFRKASRSQSEGENKFHHKFVCGRYKYPAVNHYLFSHGSLARTIAVINEATLTYKLFRWNYAKLCKFLINDPRANADPNRIKPPSFSRRFEAIEDEE